ncbi:MAG: radical SAM protein [Desulfobacterota bacterium]|nr:radical SAM protein [Thermodesulfobacteriota bacterium]
MPLTVNEIFYSIQGESSYAGLPCVFIRLTGCNLRCRYCDTRYAYTEGISMELGDVITAVTSFPCRLVEITGGEPLLQKETPELVYQLLEQRFRVLLETNGSLDCRAIDPRCIKIMDIKCPSSGESEHNRLENLYCLSAHDEIKCVLATRKDYEFARALIPRIRTATPCSSILFSPVRGLLDPALLAAWILDDGLPVRLNLQLHKIIWPDRTRGV